MMLLFPVVFGVGIIRSFFTPEKTRAFLSGKSEFAGNVLAALLGIVTPFLYILRHTTPCAVLTVDIQAR